MKKIFQKYDNFEERLLIGSLFFNVLLIFSQILMRTIFNLPSVPSNSIYLLLSSSSIFL